MSYSLSVIGNSDQLPESLINNFGENYPESAEGVEEAVSVAVEAVRSWAALTGDGGKFAASVSGHVTQGESDTFRDSLSLSISPVTE